MMRELSLHILDIVQNSVAADATEIEITIVEDSREDLIFFIIKDNGRGMNREVLDNVTNPFFTTRTTRKVGLGIPMLKEATEACGGSLDIDSEPGKGTSIKATFRLSHIDRPPLGDMAATLLTIISGLENIDIIYSHKKGDNIFSFSTAEMKKILEDVPLQNPEVMQWLKAFLIEGEKNL